VICRLPKADEREIEAAARKAKKSKSDWIREALLAAARTQRPKS